MTTVMFKEEFLVAYEGEFVEIQQDPSASAGTSVVDRVEEDGVDWCAWWADYWNNR